METRLTKEPLERSSEAKRGDAAAVEANGPDFGEDLVALSEGEGRTQTGPTRKPRASRRLWVWVTVAIACGSFCLGVATQRDGQVRHDPEPKEVSPPSEPQKVKELPAYYLATANGRMLQARRSVTSTPEEARDQVCKETGCVPGEFIAWA